MKKKYIAPEMEIVEMQSQTELLAGSGESLFDDDDVHPTGRENACMHGAHKWFCD